MEVPREIELRGMILDIAMHPLRPILAVGTAKGYAKIFSYTAEKEKKNHKLMSFNHFGDSCRTVHFSRNGNSLFTGSKSSIVSEIDLNVGSVTKRLSVVDGAAVYSLLAVSEYILAVGDDDGKLVIWDLRRQFPAMSLKPCEDYISAMTICGEKRVLLATSGDGSLSAFDLRSMKMEAQSEFFTDEFSCVAIMKEGKKVTVGSANAFNIFNWGEFGNISDRYPGNFSTINDIVPVNDNILAVACGDGSIRAVSIFPNQVIGVIGKHNTITAEGLSLSHDRQLVASRSFDSFVKFHDVSSLHSIDLTPDMKSVKAKSLTKSENEFFQELA